MSDSNLARVFGSSPFVLMLDAFIDNIGESYSKKEVQELSGISKGALFQHWPKLEQFKLVKVSRAFGNTKLYTLNKESLLVKDILRFEMRMIEETSPKELVVARARKARQ